LDNIALYLNFDMQASPNYEIGVLNGTNYPTAPNGSYVLMRMFEIHFTSEDLNYVLVPFNGRSDYGPFIAVGIPSGGLAAGAEGTKSTSERTLFGGLANTAYDPCYHQSCDTVANINQGGYIDFARAAADVLQQLAMQQNLRQFLLSNL